MKLIETKTGRELKIGDAVTTFRGESAILKGMRPGGVGSTGRVELQLAGAKGAGEFFPSVIGAEWRLPCGCVNHDGGPYGPGCGAETEPDAEDSQPCDPLHGLRMDSADLGEN